MKLVAAILAAAIALIVGLVLGTRSWTAQGGLPPTRDAVASALFARYGNVERDKPSVSVPSGPTTGFRTRAWWLEDADEVLAYAKRYPGG